jgi:hypothetical protein
MTLLPVLMVVIGVGMILRAVTSGGGVTSYGVVVGLFFLAAGLLRLRLHAARSRR